jgi:chlorite dismutase
MPEVTAPLTVRDATAEVPTARQHIRFAFYRVRPDWRLRPATERAADREEVAALVREIGDRDGVLIRSYSTVGTRGDADFLFWVVSERVDDLHEFSARLNRTRLAAYLESPYSYFSMTKQSMYVEKHRHENQEGRSNRLVIAPTGRRYLFVYPFVVPAQRRGASAPDEPAHRVGPQIPGREDQHHVLIRARRSGIRGRVRE